MGIHVKAQVHGTGATNTLQLLYDEMRGRRLPRLGKTLPNFLAYDSLAQRQR
jgi:hypothetical protein